MLLEFPDDILCEITSHLPAISLIHFLTSSKRLWNLRGRTLSRDMHLVSYQKYTNIKKFGDGLILATSNNCLELVEFFIRKGATEWNYAMRVAAEKGNMQLIQMFIEKGATDWNLGLKGATIGKRKDIVHFFLDKGAENFNICMFEAARACSKELIDLYIQKGADVWNWGLIGAARGGDQKIFEFFIEKGASQFDLALRHSIQAGNMHITEYFVQKRLDVDMNRALPAAVFKGNKRAVEFLVQHGANDFAKGLIYATKHGNREIIYYFADRIQDWSKVANEGLRAASEVGDSQMIEYFIQRGANDWNGAMCAAIKDRHKSTIEYFIEKGANDWNQAIEVIRDSQIYSSEKEKYNELINLFQQKRAQENQ